MGYLGNTPGESFISFAKQVFTIVNSQTAYTLDFSVVDENELRLVINNVVQEPGSGKAYTASGTTLTLSAALTNGTDEMYCVFLGKARETVTVPTITKDKFNLISTSSSAGLEVKGDGTTDGTLQLNCSQNSHGIKLASPPHSAGQSYTLTFPQSISADTFLKTDGSGNLSFASAGGTNTPAFSAYLNADQTSLADNVWVKVAANEEFYDTDGKYDVSNYRFTPTVSGKYMFGASLYIEGSNTMNSSRLALYKNGSKFLYKEENADDITTQQLTGVIELDSDDYVELYIKVDVASSGTFFVNQDGSPANNRAYWYGYKIIE